MNNICKNIVYAAVLAVLSVCLFSAAGECCHADARDDIERYRAYYEAKADHARRQLEDITSGMMNNVRLEAAAALCAEKQDVLTERSAVIDDAVIEGKENGAFLINAQNPFFASGHDTLNSLSGGSGVSAIQIYNFGADRLNVRNRGNSAARIKLISYYLGL